MVLSASIVGYFVGLQSPIQSETAIAEGAKELDGLEAGDTLVSTSYLDMPHSRSSAAVDESTARFLAAAEMPSQDNLIEVSAADKTAALAIREARRAFNGAPPTVPHAIDQMDASTCATCHSGGHVSASLRIPKMSHQFLANCTQCHVEQAFAKPLAADWDIENSFAGLAAPTGGPRAFPGAPPQMPHPTWMRDDCTSCHGPASLKGLQTTHPWRHSCTQCHTPASALEQNLLETEAALLPGPRVD